MIYRLRLVPSRHYEYISPSVKEVLGYTPEECYADPDLIFRTVHPDFRRQVQTARKGKGPFDQYQELCAFHKGGRLVWLERLHIPIYDDAGILVAIEGISRDISKRKESEKALKRARRAYWQPRKSLISAALNAI